MRWSIIRLIWLRELRDQLRDRRTLFMIAVLPIFLYPVAGIGLMQLVVGFRGQPNAVRLVGYEHLPKPSPLPAASWLAFTPPPPGCIGIESFAGAAALSLTCQQFQFAPLIVAVGGGKYRFSAQFFDSALDPDSLTVDLAEDPVDLDRQRADLNTRKVDLILVVPPNFAAELAQDKPGLDLLIRNDDRSQLVYNRVRGILARWKTRLKETRLLRRGLPADFDEPFELRDAETAKTTIRKASDELSKILAQIFPFVLVMWSLAGALYPAVDLCAGEKERGTMETLLISPASREEIVWGKFLTIWVFSAATALLNLLSMAVTTWCFTRLGDLVSFRLSFLIWSAILLLPLSAFFSATCLAVGVYARSSKEGQYYLMPLFLVTMPLVFLTLAPGVELNHFYSMVPVTGVALLLQALIKNEAGGGALAIYFVPVLAPMVIYSWLALRWAIEQFQREEVLFREAERLDVGLWLKRLFREKDQLPSTGQALFCFLLLLVFHWIGMMAVAARLFQSRSSLEVVGSLAVVYLALIAVPLFMGLLLTRRPRLGLGLRAPPAWSWPVAVLLAVFLVVVGAVLTAYLVHQPVIGDSLKASQPALRDEESKTVGPAAIAVIVVTVMLFALAQALCEELAFRGFILTGLRRRFRPWPAILISSFLFAVFQLNVFQCLPHFAMGVVLGFLVWRCGSILPAVLFHMVYNAVLYLLLVLQAGSTSRLGSLVDANGHLSPLAVTLGVVAGVLAVGVLVGMSFLPKRPDAVETLASAEMKKS